MPNLWVPLYMRGLFLNTKNPLTKRGLWSIKYRSAIAIMFIHYYHFSFVFFYVRTLMLRYIMSRSLFESYQSSFFKVIHNYLGKYLDLATIHQNELAIEGFIAFCKQAQGRSYHQRLLLYRIPLEAHGVFLLWRRGFYQLVIFLAW